MNSLLFNSLCFGVLSVYVIDIVSCQSGICNSDETQLRLEWIKLSGTYLHRTKFEIDQSDRGTYTQIGGYLGESQVSMANICVPNNDCNIGIIEEASGESDFNVYEIADDGSETQIVDHTFPSRRRNVLSGIYLFCVTAHNYIVPDIPDPVTNECSGYNEGLIEIYIYATAFPEEAGWFVYDSNNNNKVVWYSDVGNDRINVNSWQACLPAGNYIFRIFSGHQNTLHGIEGFYQINIDGNEMAYVAGNAFGGPWSLTDTKSFIIEPDCPLLCSTSPCNVEEAGACSVYHDGQGCSQCDINNDYFLKNVDTPCLQCQETFGNECIHCSNDGCQQCNGNFDRVFDDECGLYYCEANPCYFDENNCVTCNNGECSQCKTGYVKFNDNTKCVDCQLTFGNLCLHCDDHNGCQQCIQGFEHLRRFDNTTQRYYCQQDSTHA